MAPALLVTEHRSVALEARPEANFPLQRRSFACYRTRRWTIEVAIGQSRQVSEPLPRNAAFPATRMSK